MPSMPRFDTKATKIAYKILGVPANIKAKRTPKQEKINKQLVFQETTRMK